MNEKQDLQWINKMTAVSTDILEIIWIVNGFNLLANSLV